MTTPAQPPPPSAGDEREDQAIAAGAAAAAVLAAAQMTILAAMAAAISAVVAGTLGVQMAKRKVRRAVSAALGAAAGRLGQVYADAAKQAAAGGEAAGQPGRPGSAASHHAAGKGGGGKRGPKLPDAPAQVERAILNAQRDAGEAFDAAMHAALGGKGSPLPASNPYRDAVDKAMRRLTGIGADVKDLAGAERAAQSLSRLQAAQRVMDDLAAKGLTGFTDSAGRRWSLDAYAEMATRTAASRLHLSSQLSAMAQAGNRLVIVDNPAMTASCPRCRPWEGRVLALYGEGSGISMIADASGQTQAAMIAGTLAEAVAAGLMHPSCRHDLRPWADGAGAIATAGGQPRGYVVNGQLVYDQLPVGSPAGYANEQRLRAHERNVRRASMRVSAAVTPQARSQARAHLAHARAGLEAHVRATGVTRLRGRERPARAR